MIRLGCLRDPPLIILKRRRNPLSLSYLCVYIKKEKAQKLCEEREGRERKRKRKRGMMSSGSCIRIALSESS
ncbi:hypothetical protein L2E82_15721 [Cichorium intybus]|uniref:Uncharacterized protein n=1 Tax=Cichorium intybus TaxID=13427 RepID=A0ACB9F3L1_CICIN|nr:hypothetical protein L2E82_15721 [Cichorium intybus]